MQETNHFRKQMARHSWYLLIWVGGWLINTIEGEQSCCVFLSRFHTVCICVVVISLVVMVFYLMGNLLTMAFCKITEFVTKSTLIVCVCVCVCICRFLSLWLYMCGNESVHTFLCVSVCMCKSWTQVHCLKVDELWGVHVCVCACMCVCGWRDDRVCQEDSSPKIPEHEIRSNSKYQKNKGERTWRYLCKSLSSTELENWIFLKMHLFMY